MSFLQILQTLKKISSPSTIVGAVASVSSLSILNRRIQFGSGDGGHDDVELAGSGAALGPLLLRRPPRPHRERPVLAAGEVRRVRVRGAPRRRGHHRHRSLPGPGLPGQPGRVAIPEGGRRLLRTSRLARRPPAPSAVSGPNLPRCS